MYIENVLQININKMTNIYTKNLQTKIRWLKLPGMFSMGLGIPPLEIKILPVNNQGLKEIAPSGSLYKHV